MLKLKKIGSCVRKPLAQPWMKIKVENMVGKITNHNRIWSRYPLCIAMAVCIKVPVLQHICSKIWDSFAYTPSWDKLGLTLFS